MSAYFNAAAGGECSTSGGANPLTQLLSNVGPVVGAPGSGASSSKMPPRGVHQQQPPPSVHAHAQHLPSVDTASMAYQQATSEFRDFAAHHPQANVPLQAMPQMDALEQRLRDMAMHQAVAHQQASARDGAPVSAAQWAADFQAHATTGSAPLSRGGSAQFESTTQPIMQQEHIMSQQQMQKRPLPMPMMMPSSYSMPMLQHNNPMERAFIDKLSTSAAAWDSKLDALLQEQESAAATQTIDDATWEREFAKHQELIANATEQINKRDQGVEQAFSEFQDVWKSADGGANFDADDDEFRSLGDDPGLDGAFHQSNSTRFQNLTYQFEAENAYLSHADPFAEGMRLVESNGSLTQAALAFEAAVQKDPQHADAWANLGRVQAENEKEEPAIAALQHAVRSNPAHSEALMALSVSYTNEGCDREAFVTLDQWLHGAYPDVHTPHDRDMEIMPINELYDHVIEGFLKAVRRDTANVDANVQVGLGILFYNSGQYDKAVDCFNTALQIRPNDYQLWNRLGATLANSGKSEQAIDAYHHALAIKPTYVRGRYNLGVSCMNIGCYKEAAEHFLGALDAHQKEGGSAMKNVSVNLWDTLRRTFVNMERTDLMDKAVNGANVDQFRVEFDF